MGEGEGETDGSVFTFNVLSDGAKEERDELKLEDEDDLPCNCEVAKEGEELIDEEVEEI